jgi:hypothetical protein
MRKALHNNSGGVDIHQINKEFNMLKQWKAESARDSNIKKVVRKDGIVYLIAQDRSSPESHLDEASKKSPHQL